MGIQPKTLLLDLDGTLLGMHSKRGHLAFGLSIVRNWGAEIPPWTALQAIREVDRAMRSLDLSTTNVERAIAAFARVTGLPPEVAAIRLLKSSEQIFPTLEPYFYPMPGAADFVRWAYERYSLVLATEPVWMREIIEHRVRWAGLDPAMFRFISHAAVMRACKPRVEYYRQLLEINGLVASECLMVGNEPRMDLPALQAGVPVFLVNGRSRALASRGESVWTGDFAALRALLEA